MEQGATTTPKPGVVRYMAPELFNPSQFGLSNINPSKESDVYSLAMTTHEVRSSRTLHESLLTLSLRNKTLTGMLPYGTARDGIIIFHVVTGDRPPRPPNSRWISDQIWDMIETCWSEKREQRWDIRAMYNQLSVSSIQEIPEAEQGNRCAFSTSDID